MVYSYTYTGTSTLLNVVEAIKVQTAFSKSNANCYIIGSRTVAVSLTLLPK